MQQEKNKFFKDFYRSILAELIGTFFLVAIIIGGGSQTLLSSNTDGNSFSNCVSVGFGVMVAVRMSLKVSGGHLNPCVTTTMALIGRFPWKMVPFYILAQFLGSFLAAACGFFVYKGALINYSGGTNYTTLDTASAYTSFPQSFLSMNNAFLDSAFGSAMLIIPIMAMNDKRNFGVPQNVAPIFYGLLVTSISGAFALNSGNPINPARDFGPRVFLAVAGWGSQVFSGPNYEWWWLPLVAPSIGGAIGGFIYLVLIEMHHPDEKQLEEKGEDKFKSDIDYEYTKPSVIPTIDNDMSGILIS